MKNLFIVLIAMFMLSGCSEEGEKPEIPVPDSPGIVEESVVTRTLHLTIEEKNQGERLLTLSEIMLSDAPPVDKTETYTFEKNRLVSHVIEQNYYPEQTTTFENVLTYSGNSVVATDMNGNTLTYRLGPNGYATSCVRYTPDQTRTYSFEYSPEGYLTSLEEKIAGDPFSSLRIVYKEGDITSVTAAVREIGNPIVYQPGEEENIDDLPCIGLSETYPLSIHIEALYGGLLGKSTRHLTRKISSEGNDNEWNVYTYFKNETGEKCQIRISTHYKGTVYLSKPPLTP